VTTFASFGSLWLLPRIEAFQRQHPDIDIRWNKVTLALTTHDQGGLTAKDFALAKRFDAAARR